MTDTMPPALCPQEASSNRTKWGSERNPRDSNRLQAQDSGAHDWYRFVLSFPPHLVREYLQRFGMGGEQRVLDPFCGTGTTLVECKKQGIASIGMEASPMAHFASQTKTNWTPDADELVACAERIASMVGVTDNSNRGELLTLPPETARLLLTNSISPLPLHKTLLLLTALHEQATGRYKSHLKLALAKSLVTRIGNLRFGPEVGVGAIKTDADVVGAWLACVYNIAEDLRLLRQLPTTACDVYSADAREPARVLPPQSVHAVITSPPYPNEKDYTRTTRLESVLLGFIKDKSELQTLKRRLLRSNTRNVYRGDTDEDWIADHPEIFCLAETIEARRIALGKTSGFERLYAQVTRSYFGGMARHLADLRTVLCPGAQLAYVVGDQASYFRILIRTGQHLAAIAQSLGYELIGIDLFRTRFSTTTKAELREEVVVLRWPGTGAHHGKS